MTFWKVKFKHTVYENGDYPYDEAMSPNYFATMEECMAFVLDQHHLDISQVEFTRCSLGTWKSKILLNDPDREVK